MFSLRLLSCRLYQCCPCCDMLTSAAPSILPQLRFTTTERGAGTSNPTNFGTSPLFGLSGGWIPLPGTD